MLTSRTRFLLQRATATTAQRYFNMGTVFGIENVEEPSFNVLVDRTGVPTTYQVREYGKRVAIETSMGGVDDNKPFFKLAKYIGVIGEAENEGKQAMAMTAPVVMSAGGGGEKIAMTAPVVRTDRVMQFILPKEYDSKDKAPKPTNNDVIVKEIPAEIGVVKRYSGSFDAKLCESKAREIAGQLREDGVDLSEEFVTKSHRFFGYNPPFCLPMFRRNEVWIPLTKKQASQLQSKFPLETAVN